MPKIDGMGTMDLEKWPPAFGIAPRGTFHYTSSHAAPQRAFSHSVRSFFGILPVQCRSKRSNSSLIGINSDAGPVMLRVSG